MFKDKKDKDKKGTLKKGQAPPATPPESPQGGTNPTTSPATRAWKSKLNEIQTKNAQGDESKSEQSKKPETPDQSLTESQSKKTLPTPPPKLQPPVPAPGVTDSLGPPPHKPVPLPPQASLTSSTPTASDSLRASTTKDKIAIFENSDAPAAPPAPFCAKCNINLKETAKFCTRCGGPLKKPTDSITTKGTLSGSGSVHPTIATPPPEPAKQAPLPPEKPRNSTNVESSNSSPQPAHASLQRNTTGRPERPMSMKILEKCQSEPRQMVFGVSKPARASAAKGVKVSNITSKQDTPAAPQNSAAATPENDKRRQLIIGELISTEKSYIVGLRELCTKYKKPITEFVTANPKVPDANLIADLFMEVDTILGISESFLSDLEQVFASWTPQSKIGKILSKTAPFFKLYSSYSKNYGTATKSLDKLMQNEWFTKFCSDRLLLDSLFILPIQRVPRYRLLVEDLIKSTPSTHPDYQDLTSSLVLIKDAASYVNAGVSDDASNDLIGFNLIGHLVVPHRKLVKQGSMSITTVLRYDSDEKPKNKKNVKKPYYFFLFNDILVVVRERKEAKESGHASLRGKKSTKINWDEKDDINWPLELTWVHDLKKEDKGSFEFEIIGPMKTITISTTEQEKFKWMSALNSTIQTVLNDIDPGVGKNAASDLIERHGTYKFPNGAIYTGWWDLGRMQPYGSYEYKNTYYEGAFVLNVMFGRGSMEFEDGSIYEGEFKSGKPNGQGTYVTINGDKYIGDWVKGKRQGKGVLSFVNGDRFEGEWKQNQIEEGVLYLANLNTTYEGPFVAGKYHGTGKLITPKGKFQGEFESGKEVDGVFVSTDGSITYEGSWKNGFWNGQGVLKTKDYVYTGSFARDLYEGRGIIEYANGYVFEGNFQSGLRHGKGKFYFKGVGTSPVGLVHTYNGDWAFDARHGQGEIIFSNGNIYNGTVQNGQPHGTGKMNFKNGTVIEGKFQNGLLEGKFEMIANGTTESVTVEEDGGIANDPGSEYLVPPFLPLFQFQ